MFCWQSWSSGLTRSRCRSDGFWPTRRGRFTSAVASLWEIAIKHRLGKLVLSVGLDALPELIRALGIELLTVDEHHVMAFVRPEPMTRDPFDRLLLAQCLVEGLRLVTVDRALVSHGLAAG
jgi:PIN domain nuclease of toxin-antitoxin system